MARKKTASFQDGFRQTRLNFAPLIVSAKKPSQGSAQNPFVIADGDQGGQDAPPRHEQPHQQHRGHLRRREEIHVEDNVGNKRLRADSELAFRRTIPTARTALTELPTNDAAWPTVPAKSVTPGGGSKGKGKGKEVEVTEGTDQRPASIRDESEVRVENARRYMEAQEGIVCYHIGAGLPRDSAVYREALESSARAAVAFQQVLWEEEDSRGMTKAAQELASQMGTVQQPITPWLVPE